MPTLNSATLGKFCREISGGLSEIATLLEEWGLTPDEYERLRQSPGFQHEMELVFKEMQEMGPDAGYVYRMKSLAEEQLSEIVKLMSDPATTTSQKIELIRFCAEMGRLKEKAIPLSQQGAPRGPSVVFHFGAGLPVQSVTVRPELEVLEAEEASDRSSDTFGFDMVPG